MLKGAKYRKGQKRGNYMMSGNANQYIVVGIGNYEQESEPMSYEEAKAFLADQVEYTYGTYADSKSCDDYEYTEDFYKRADGWNDDYQCFIIEPFITDESIEGLVEKIRLRLRRASIRGEKDAYMDSCDVDTDLNKIESLLDELEKLVAKEAGEEK